jgi:phosphate transport system ATP-binding protein
MNDIVQTFHMNGMISIDGKDIYRDKIDITSHRKKVGMVFQKANPFPMSIYENVAYGLRVNNIKHKKFLDESVEKSLKMAALWEEVKDILDKPAIHLSVGQQQRLCIARALAVEPSIVLMDEPASALDPISTAKVEELIHELKKKYTILVVTHNMQQAARISDKTAFLYMGEIIEFDDTKRIFTAPQSEQTENYITGRFG